MKKKKIISIIMLSIYLFSSVCFASVIGTEIDSYTIPVAEKTVFTHTTSFSGQSGVGKQTENYLIYEPNDSVKPIITYGDYLYGAGRTSEEISSLLSHGKYTVAGANADFFSFQTGVPMSNLLIDGRIVTKDESEQHGIGFNEDGSAFMSKFSIFSSMIKEDGTEIIIHNINKYRQPYAIYLMTDEFSKETQNTSVGVDVVLSVVEGDMILGTEMTAIVDSVTENYNSTPIPEGKIVLTVDNRAPTEFYESLASLSEGETVTFKFEAFGDERWNNVKLGMGATGGMLLSDGEVNRELEKGTAPRTALGITEDGKIVLYTIDGRQSGYSYGVQLSTLAKRMKELGCTDAINLDGGGSTTFVAALPGMKHEILNSPSDSSERKVSTYFLFENMEEPTGEADKLFIYPRTSYLLAGAMLKLETKAVDENYYPAELPSKVTYSVEQGKNSSVTDEGIFTAADSGQVKVTAQSGDIMADILITSFETPTDIYVVNADNGKTLHEITIKRGEKIKLDAVAFSGHNELISSFNLFNWSVEGEIGTLSDDGTFTAANSFDKEGILRVSAGEKIVEIPVKLIKNGSESEDALGFDIIAEMERNILKGEIKPVQNGMPSKLSVFADGKEINADIKGTVFTAKVPEETHKITVYAFSDKGFTDVKYIYIDKAEIKNPFVDTDTNWAKDILSYMYGQKIISGENTDKGLMFRPQKEMTRAEFAVMCSNYLGIDFAEYKEKRMPFADEEAIPGWAKNQIKALYYEGIFNGRAAGENVIADPMSTITRAEAATILSRLMPEGMKLSEITADDKSDIPEWALEAMEMLYHAGVMNGYTDGTIKPLGKLTKAEAAKLFYAIM